MRDPLRRETRNAGLSQQKHTRSRRQAKRLLPVLVLCLMLLTASSLCSEITRSTSGLDLDFKNASISDVIRALSAQTGQNFVLGEDSVGTVTLRMTDVTLEEVLEAISKATGVEFVMENGYIVVSPSRLLTRTFAVKYVDAASAKEAVAKFLSQRGRVEAFPGESSTKLRAGPRVSNVLIVSDTERRLSLVEELLGQIDTKPKQVAIEARLIETTLGSEDRLGINWQVNFEVTGAVAPTVLPFSKNSGAGIVPTPNPQAGSGTETAEFPDGELFPYARSGDFTFGKLNGAQLQAALEMIASRTDANLVANPRVTTIKNRAAEITVGTVVPIALYERQRETGIMEIVGYEEKKVGMKLVVIPRVGDDSIIVLKVHPEVSEIVEYRGQYNERPITSTREAQTEVMVRSGETLVIGGLVKEIENTTVTKVPFLGDIPLLGRFFRYELKKKQKTDLLVFVTPHLLPE